MKYVIALVIGIVLFFLSFLFIHELFYDLDDDLIGIIAIIIAVISATYTYKYLKKTGLKETAALGVSKLKSTIDDVSSIVDDKETVFFAKAEKEIDNGEIDEGLWSLALVKSKGDENLRKAEYIKLRVKQLKKEKDNN